MRKTQSCALTRSGVRRGRQDGRTQAAWPQPQAAAVAPLLPLLRSLQTRGPLGLGAPLTSPGAGLCNVVAAALPPPPGPEPVAGGSPGCQ